SPRSSTARSAVLRSSCIRGKPSRYDTSGITPPYPIIMVARGPPVRFNEIVFLSQRVHITSPSNPLIKDIRRAVRRGEATEDGLAIAESPHLLEEAVRSGIPVAATLLAETAGPAI